MCASYTPLNVHDHAVAKEAFSKALIREKNDWIHKQLEGLNVQDSIAFWKNYKRTIAGGTHDFMGNLFENNVLYTDTNQKENVLYESFFSGKHMDQGTFDNTFGDYIHRKYEDIVDSN